MSMGLDLRDRWSAYVAIDLAIDNDDAEEMF